jgi:hypothetical protein
MLCPKCTSIHFRLFEACPPAVQELEVKRLGDMKDTKNDYRLFFQHSCNLRCLQRTADTGCQFCLKIQAQLYNGRSLAQGKGPESHIILTLFRMPRRDALKTLETGVLGVFFEQKAYRFPPLVPQMAGESLYPFG